MSSNDTWTPQGMAKRFSEIINGYIQTHNWPALARLAGLTRHDFDYTEADAGEPPKGAVWN
jgi:hypothetical protein